MSNQPTPIRVVVIDDHFVVRQGFATLLKAFPDILLVGEAEGGNEGIVLCERLQPDVVLMDMMMPGMSGVEATRLIRTRFSRIQVIGITSFSDDKQLVQAATEAGALGFLFKDVSINELANAIRNVHQGIPTLSPGAFRLLVQAKSRRTSQDFNLSEREQGVLRLMAQGLGNHEISQQLTISLATTKFHVSNILHKLAVTNRAEAIALAFQLKLV